MPEFEVIFKSRVSGPISSGKMERDVRAYEHDVAEALAEDAENIVLRNLGNSLRFPTGYYESRISTRELTSTRYEVHDGGVVYGPWLEGTGSRNRPRPGFPGYWSFKKAEETAKSRRGNVARKILRRYRASGRLT